MYMVKVKDKSLLPSWIKVDDKGEITLPNDWYKSWHEKGTIQKRKHYYTITKTVSCPTCQHTHKHHYKKYLTHQTIKKINKE